MEFAKAWEFLAPAVERDGEHTMESVLTALSKGIRRLWVSDTSAAVTEIRHHPSGLVVGHAWLAGGDLKEILSWLPLWEAWSKAHGATQTRVSARRGWVRALGYKEFRVSMAKDL
jgi:hypothetical protein